MRPVALGAIALIASVTVGAPVMADDALANNAGMSHGWNFSEEGGADLFQNVCAGCHQPDAKGAVGAGAYPSLVADGNLAESDFVLTVLLRGLDGMPPLGDMMSDPQVADVVNYVRTHFGNSYTGTLSAADVAAARRRAARP